MLNVVYQTDVLDKFQYFKDNYFQLILADPPYNYNKDFGNGSDRLDYEEYKVFSKKWITECIRVLDPQGTLFIYGLTPINWFIWGILREFCESPEKQLRELIWYYTNKQIPKMNFYRPAHENIIVYFKNKDYHTFNEDPVREPYETNYIKFAGKKRPEGNSRFGKKESVYNVNAKGALPRDVLKIGTLAGGNGKERIIGNGAIKHPTQKPEKLTRKLILGSTNEDDVVFIPFAGSGTEVILSCLLNRKFVGCEINPEYIQIIKQRFFDNKIPISETNNTLLLRNDFKNTLKTSN